MTPGSTCRTRRTALVEGSRGHLVWTHLQESQLPTGLEPKDSADTPRAAGTPARPPCYHSPLRPASGHAQRGLGKDDTQGETPGWSGWSLGRPDLDTWVKGEQRKEGS